MVDEKILIKRLQDCVAASDNSNFTNGLLSAINIIEQQAKTSNWIPCSERLPEESLNAVIGWDEYRNRCCFVQYYSGRWNLGDNREPVKITAWQPVPEAYKEEDD